MNNNKDYTKTFVFLSDHSKKNLVNRFGSHSTLKKDISFRIYTYFKYGYAKDRVPLFSFDRKSSTDNRYTNFNKYQYMHNYLFNTTIKSISGRVLTFNNYSCAEDPFYDDDYNYYTQKKEEERKATIFLRLIRKLRGNK